MTTFYEGLVSELELLLEPVADAADDDRARRDLLAGIGLDLTDTERAALDARFDALASAYDDLVALASGDGEALEDLLTALQVVRHLFEGLNGLADDLPANDIDAGDVVEYLVLEYLFTSRPLVLQALTLLTVVSYPDPVESNRDPALDRLSLPPGTTVDFERVADLTSDPASVLLDAYAPTAVTDPEEARRIGRLLFPLLTKFAGLLGCKLATSTTPFDTPSFGGISGLTLASRSVTVFREFDGSGYVGVQLALASSNDGLCLLAVPLGEATVDHDLNGWSVGFTLGAGFDLVVVNPDGVVYAEPETGEVDGRLSLDRTGPAGEPAAVLGPAEGTRLELGDVGLTATWRFAEGAMDAGGEAATTDSRLVVAPDDPDGFLASVLPAEGFAVEFGAGVGWSTDRGLYFVGGGAGLAADIPVSFSLGEVLTVETLSLAARVDPGTTPMTVPVHLAASPQVQLGPLSATIERLGLQANLTFPEDADGNLGPVNVDLGFKPPSGAGIGVDASAVVGGGYLSFDPENERYAGTLQLTIGSLTLTAVGLLTTRFPDGRDGFSLLVIITGEFPPLQLGFGFTLTGLGGLLGINRGTNTDVLRSGLRDGTLKSVLFPADPLRNAPRIVSDLRRVFPPTAGRHVFGPMARLGWGTPTIMTADIGVLLALPSPVKLVILGRLRAALPDDDAALVVFNMDALGVIDFGAQEASLDATLYDSRVVAYTLSGDMALRTNWGDDPSFALSVGGFHPRFDPPPAFPSLRRVSLSIGPGNPLIRWSGYFAITSNTVQVGSNVDMTASAGGFGLSGHLGFDALFEFDPFRFGVDIAARFAVKAGGATLLSVSLKGSLKGPTPWHVRGRAKFSIWPLSFSVSVDATFGESADPDPLPPADVFGLLVDALSDERNWSAQLPEGDSSVVTLREIDPESGTVLAHPLGTLEVRQRVTPLGVTIETFGNAQPAPYTRFGIESVQVADESQPDAGELRERFAPAQFFALSDAEKLAGPAFERYPAGRRVGNRLFAFGGESNATLKRSVRLDYETSIVDVRESAFALSWGQFAMPQTTAAALAEVGAVARAPLRTTGSAKFAGTDAASGPTGIDGPVTVSDTGYVVARASDLRRVKIDGVPAVGTTKREAAEALDALSDAADDAYRVVGSHEARGPEVSP